MSRDVAAEMRDFSQDEPTHRGMAQFWASQVEAMQRRIAELEANIEGFEDLLVEKDREIGLTESEWAVQHDDGFREGVRAQAERDRAVIEAARKAKFHLMPVEEIKNLDYIPNIWVIEASDHDALIDAIRLHDEATP